MDALGILAACGSEVGLTAATTLYELGRLADVLADVYAIGYYAVGGCGGE